MACRLSWCLFLARPRGISWVWTWVSGHPRLRHWQQRQPVVSLRCTSPWLPCPCWSGNWSFESQSDHAQLISKLKAFHKVWNRMWIFKFRLNFKPRSVLLTMRFHCWYLSCISRSAFVPKSFAMMPPTGVWGLFGLPYARCWFLSPPNLLWWVFPNGIRTSLLRRNSENYCKGTVELRARLWLND